MKESRDRAGSCQVMGKHLAESSMHCVFFHDEQPACGGRCNKFCGNIR